jgi:hypothetical protein
MSTAHHAIFHLNKRFEIYRSRFLCMLVLCFDTSIYRIVQRLDKIMETHLYCTISLAIWCWATFCLQYSRNPSWTGLVQVLNSL